MKTKNALSLFMAIIAIAFTSCGDDGNDDINNIKPGREQGVHKIEVTITSNSENFATVLGFTGIGRDGLNANAALYNETNQKCGDGIYMRTIENGVGTHFCYTAPDATGMMGTFGVALYDESTTVTMVCVAYVNDKETSRIEKVFTSKDSSLVTIQTHS
jgi:hypothetical protein